MFFSIAPRHLFLFLALPLLGLFFWKGFQNQPDSVWYETADLLKQQPVMLADQPDSLQQISCSIHHVPCLPGDSSAWRFAVAPFQSNIEWESFRTLLDQTLRQRFIVISGVTGSGSTKYAKHIGRLLAGSESHLLEIDCAPLFDLEYHKKYIGQELQGHFEPGLLLRFWQQCLAQPDQPFVAVIDNFDKINPETFFGPVLWETLSSTRNTAVIEGLAVTIPKNFYLISATHLGPGSLIELNQEHFKRIGLQYALEPKMSELKAWLLEQEHKLGAIPHPSPETSARLAALRDTNQLHRFLYYFAKTNQLICQKYGPGFQLGQGSNARECYRAGDLDALKATFINHINALRPSHPLLPAEFKPMDFTVANDGLEPGTNFIARQLRMLQSTGYLVEISMVATTALLTALAGWWVFRRREQLMRLYGDRVQEIYAHFENQDSSAEEAATQLETIKAEVDTLVMRRKLNYTEALYFLAFIEDKVRRIEFARNVSENFLELFNAFMDDNILTEKEYNKLLQFLESIRHKIPLETYRQFLFKVQQAYETSAG